MDAPYSNNLLSMHSTGGYYANSNITPEILQINLDLKIKNLCNRLLIDSIDYANKIDSQALLRFNFVHEQLFLLTDNLFHQIAEQAMKNGIFLRKNDKNLLGLPVNNSLLKDYKNSREDRKDENELLLSFICYWSPMNEHFKDIYKNIIEEEIFQTNINQTLSQALWNNVLTNEFTDISFNCLNNKKIHAHKIILAASSSEFKSRLINNSNIESIFEDISHDLAMIFLQGIYYSDSINLEILLVEDIIKLLKLSIKYKCSNYKFWQTCVIHNFCMLRHLGALNEELYNDIFELAIRNYMSGLIDLCLKSAEDNEVFMKYYYSKINYFLNNRDYDTILWINKTINEKRLEKLINLTQPIASCAECLVEELTSKKRKRSEMDIDSF